ncbi:hypothetical protein B0J11DRAFT_293213 [Dendryphion nanum]|uniref:Condensation domain-containing protein n=1 Tax=Dendryphion nanum TaxID=256645 RepID=A0A9P9DXG7_9PLEO|nr:hypothetical protein B0J11DRAFT_293213 [Dendryphion nanum]
MTQTHEHSIGHLGYNIDKINGNSLDNRISGIERCLDKVDGVKAQVVDIHGSGAEELLVAVLLLSGAAADKRYTTIQKLQNATTRELMPGLIPHTYVSLGQLGLEAFPSRTHLTETVRQYLATKDSGSIPTNGHDSSSIVARVGPPTERHMIHCQGDIDMAIITENLATPRLEELGLSWRDVEDVFPAPDTSWIYLNRQRPQTWNQRVIYTAQNIDVEILTEVWQEVVTYHPMFRALSIPVPKSLDARFGGAKHLFVTLRPDEDLWYQSITTGLEVESHEDLHKTFVNQWADPLYGPLVHVACIKIKNTDSSALILIGNQAAFDNSSYTLMLEDLNKALENILLQDPDHISPKELADHYWSYRSTSSSAEAASYHANRLRGIGNEQASLWPKKRVYGWFKGNDDGWLMPDGTPGNPEMREPIDPVEDQHGLHGLVRSVQLQGLKTIQRTHGISPNVIFKVAIALFNLKKTGAKTALFTGRETTQDRPSTSSDNHPRAIAGPTTHVILNRVQLPRAGTTVLDFLRKEQEEHVLMAKHAQAPLWQIIELLNPADREVFFDALMRQGFRSEVNKNVKETVLVQFERQSLDDAGLTWSFDVSDSDHVKLEATYDDCQLSKDVVYNAIGQVLSAAAWLIDPTNITKGVDKCVFQESRVNSLAKDLV